MAPKRKLNSEDVLEISDSYSDDSIDGHSAKENDAPLPKKARVSDASEGAEPGASTVKPKGKGKASVDQAPAPTRWQDVVLEISSNVSHRTCLG